MSDYISSDEITRIWASILATDQIDQKVREYVEAGATPTPEGIDEMFTVQKQLEMVEAMNDMKNAQYNANQVSLREYEGFMSGPLQMQAMLDSWIQGIHDPELDKATCKQIERELQFSPIRNAYNQWVEGLEEKGLIPSIEDIVNNPDVRVTFPRQSGRGLTKAYIYRFDPKEGRKYI